VKESHVEIINPRERLSPELGGTGYLPPATRATAAELANDAAAQAEAFGIGLAVWKVRMVNTHRPKRLCIEGRHLACDVIGSVRDWWFVSVDATKAAKVLGK
jgi:hypothetical protein